MVNGFVPTSLADALQLRSQQKLIPYAGGTDLMTEEERPGSYLFLHSIPELKKVERVGDVLHIGAGCTFSQLIQHKETPALLKEALCKIAAPAIRNEGTIGGNISNGSAKADSALIFFVADAKLKLASVQGERVIPIKDFYQGRKKLDMHPDELLVEVLLPTKWIEDYFYEKVGARKALAISRLSFVGLLSVQGGVIQHCATAYGAVSDVIIRRADIDEMLIGKTIAEAKAIKSDYIAAYDEAIVPIRGRVSSEYRKSTCLRFLNAYLEKFGI